MKKGKETTQTRADFPDHAHVQVHISSTQKYK